MSEEEYESDGPTRPAMNRAERRSKMPANAKKPMRNLLEEEQARQKVQDAAGGIAKLFQGKPKAEAAYTPVLKAFETIGLDPKMMSIAIGGSDDAVQCFVIPVQDLVYKEWQYMTKANYELRDLGEEDNV